MKKAEEKSQKNILRSSLVVSLFMLVGKVAGAFFKVPLTAIIGAEGMGIYQMVFPVFVLLFSVSSSGFSTAITVSFGDKSSRHKNGSYLRYAKLGALVIALFVSAIVFVISPVFAKIQKNEQVQVVYKIMPIAIVAVSLLSVKKGQIRAMGEFCKYSLAESAEQVLKVIIALVLAGLLSAYSGGIGVAGVFVGIAFSTLPAFIILNFKNSKKLNFAPLTKPEKKGFLKISFYSTLLAILVPFVQFLDSVVTTNCLVSAGLSSGLATSLYGLSRGSVSVLINLPMVAIGALELVMLPDLIKSDGDKQSKVKLSVLIALFVCLPFGFLYTLFPEVIIKTLYGASLPEWQLVQTVRLLRVGGFTSVIAGLTSVTTVALQGLKKFYLPVISLGLAGVSKLGLELLIVPKVGIIGAELGTLIFYLVACLINCIMLNACKLRVGSAGNLVPIATAGVAFSAALILFNSLKGAIGELVALLLLGLIFGAGYLVVMVAILKKQTCVNKSRRAGS